MRQNIKDKRIELIKSILLTLFVLSLCLIVFEKTVTILWEESYYGYPKGLHVPDDAKGYKYKPFFVGKFADKPYKDIEIKINSKGLRDIEHEYNKPTGKIRILGLGDSTTFGSGVNYEDTYLKQLENKLLEYGFNVEIINAGVNSYEFDQEYTYYFEEGYKYHPDIVLIGVVLNDIQEVNSIKLKERMFKGGQSKSFLVKHFKSIRFISSYLAKIKMGGNHDDQEVKRIYSLWEGKSWKNYKTKLLNLNEKLKKDNKKLILVIFPYTQQFSASLNYVRLPQNKIISLGLENNITVIDLMPYLDLPNYKDYYLLHETLHLNKQGYNLVKEIIFEELSDEIIR